MNQPDVLSQMQPEGEQNAEDQAGPEESAIPTDPSEGKWEQRVAPVSLSWSETVAQHKAAGLGAPRSLCAAAARAARSVGGRAERSPCPCLHHQHHTAEGC